MTQWKLIRITRKVCWILSKMSTNNLLSRLRGMVAHRRLSRKVLKVEGQTIDMLARCLESWASITRTSRKLLVLMLIMRQMKMIQNLIESWQRCDLTVQRLTLGLSWVVHRISTEIRHGSKFQGKLTVMTNADVSGAQLDATATRLIVVWQRGLAM